MSILSTTVQPAKQPLPYLLIQFSEVPMNDDFISPEGSLCRKVTDTHAIMLDEEDTAFQVGEAVDFNGWERVEYTPRSGI